MGEKERLSIELFVDGSEESKKAKEILNDVGIPFKESKVPEPRNRPKPPHNLNEEVKPPYLLDGQVMAPIVGIDRIRRYAINLKNDQDRGITIINPLLEEYASESFLFEEGRKNTGNELI